MFGWKRGAAQLVLAESIVCHRASVRLAQGILWFLASFFFKIRWCNCKILLLFLHNATIVVMAIQPRPSAIVVYSATSFLNNFDDAAAKYRRDKWNLCRPHPIMIKNNLYASVADACPSHVTSGPELPLYPNSQPLWFYILAGHWKWTYMYTYFKTARAIFDDLLKEWKQEYALTIKIIHPILCFLFCGCTRHGIRDSDFKTGTILVNMVKGV